MIAKNGIQLLDDWPFTFTNTTMVYFPEYPEPPQGDVFRYRIGRVRVMLPDGRQRYLDIGNVSCSRMKPNQIASYAVPISSSLFIVLDTIMSILTNSPNIHVIVIDSHPSTSPDTSNTCPPMLSHSLAARFGVKLPPICFPTLL